MVKAPRGGVLGLGKGKGLEASRAADEVRDLNHSSPTVQVERVSPR